MLVGDRQFSNIGFELPVTTKPRANVMQSC
jgi:hypothetical protein